MISLPCQLKTSVRRRRRRLAILQERLGFLRKLAFCCCCYYCAPNGYTRSLHSRVCAYCTSRSNRCQLLRRVYARWYHVERKWAAPTVCVINLNFWVYVVCAAGVLEHNGHLLQSLHSARTHPILFECTPIIASIPKSIIIRLQEPGEATEAADPKRGFCIRDFGEKALQDYFHLMPPNDFGQ